MQPYVLRQIEQNQIRLRSRDIEPAVPSRGRFSSQRGPKDRPTYRLWEYANWRARKTGFAKPHVSGLSLSINFRMAFVVRRTVRSG